jgi:hypothetical protein
VGSPAPGGVAASATIGAAGGTLKSSDGRVTVSIPAGALSADTVIGVAPITNNAHGGIGAAYRMTGTETFQVPISLTFSYLDEDLVSTAPLFLDVAFQTKDGFWQLVDEVSVDTAARTITATTTHFTDYSFVTRFRLTPASARVKVISGGQQFHIEWAYPLYGKRPKGGGIPFLGFAWKPLSVTYGGQIVSGWAVNGIPGGNSTIGTIYADIERGGYAPPDKKPSPDTVTVSVKLTNPAAVEENVRIEAKVTITDKDRIDVRATYAKQAEFLSAFVTGNVTDNGFQFQMSFPVVDELLTVMDIPGAEVRALADTRPGCVVPRVGQWDELTAESVTITGSFLTVTGTAFIPAVTVGVGEGDCATMTTTSPATTRPAGVQVSLPLEFFTSSTPPTAPVTVTQDGWTFTYTTAP